MLQLTRLAHENDQMESCCFAYPAPIVPSMTASQLFLGKLLFSPTSSCALGGAALPKFQEWASEPGLVDWDSSSPWSQLLVQKQAQDPSGSNDS